MPSKSVSQRQTSSVITYAVLAVAAIGFLAVFVYRRIYPQSRRGTRGEDNEVEDTTSVVCLCAFFCLKHIVNSNYSM